MQETRKKGQQAEILASCYDLLFDFEDEGDMFLQNAPSKTSVDVHRCTWYYVSEGSSL
jgi:hypothetical protein